MRHDSSSCHAHQRTHAGVSRLFWISTFSTRCEGTGRIRPRPLRPREPRAATAESDPSVVGGCAWQPGMDVIGQSDGLVTPRSLHVSPCQRFFFFFKHTLCDHRLESDRWQHLRIQTRDRCFVLAGLVIALQLQGVLHAPIYFAFMSELKKMAPPAVSKSLQSYQVTYFGDWGQFFTLQFQLGSFKLGSKTANGRKP